jgi:hypothetical protein
LKSKSILTAYLHAVNSAAVTLYSVLPNLYILLGPIPAGAKSFTCLNLKDTFFYIHLAPQRQPIYAFQWKISSTREKGQLTWTQLPQGFNNSPTIFGTALASALKAFLANQHGCILLHCVDDLLLAGPTLGGLYGRNLPPSPLFVEGRI